MSEHDVSAFFDRFDGMKPEGRVSPEGLIEVNDEAMAAAADAIMPMYERIAERAGLELSDLIDETSQRMSVLPGIVIARCVNGADLVGEIRGALVNIGVECFLAGVLFEQDKSLPEIDVEIDDDGDPA